MEILFTKNRCHFAIKIEIQSPNLSLRSERSKGAFILASVCISRPSANKSWYWFNSRNDVRRRLLMPNDASMNAPLKGPPLLILIEIDDGCLWSIWCVLLCKRPLVVIGLTIYTKSSCFSQIHKFHTIPNQYQAC